MGGTLWDGADQLAVLAAVGATRASAGVLAGAADQLVPASSSDQDVVSGAADQHIRAAGPVEQVREGPADQPVTPASSRERTWHAVHHRADHHGEPRIGIEGVAAPGEVSDDRSDVARGAAHLGS